MVRKDREERKTESEVRNLINCDDDEFLGLINVIVGGLSNCNGKNKRGPEEVLLVEKRSIGEVRGNMWTE